MSVRPLPRVKDPFVYDDQPILVKVPDLNGDDLLQSVVRGVELLGGLDRAMRSGDRVMLEPLPILRTSFLPI
jgi:hypothetical protein